MNKTLTLAAIAGATFASCGVSATEYVTNGGFESSAYTGSQAFFGPNTPATDWTSTGAFVLYCTTTTPTCEQIGGVGLQGAIVPSPQGGSFMGFDSDPSYSAPFTQTINGLTAGQSYTLSFYMATSSEQGSNVTTTENLTATLGGETFTTPTITTAAAAFSPWVQYSTSFIYDGTSDVLTFLAFGTPSGEPPYSLLDGVSLTDVATGAPEPATWAMLMLGLGGLGSVARSRRKAALSAA